MLGKIQPLMDPKKSNKTGIETQSNKNARPSSMHPAERHRKPRTSKAVAQFILRGFCVLEPVLASRILSVSSSARRWKALELVRSVGQLTGRGAALLPRFIISMAWLLAVTR